MRIRWTPAAAADLQHINDYLEEHHAHIGGRPCVSWYESGQALKQWPHRGRRVVEDGTRELVFSPLPYVTVYRVTRQGIESMRNLHERRICP